LDLERYADAFVANEIDAEILPKLNAEDLKDLGVELVGHRRRLVDAIAALHASRTVAAPDPTASFALTPVIDAGAVRSEPERRQLTVLFSDLVGSTALAARLDPEDMAAVIRAYQECCAQVIRRWGGHVAKYMGDGVLAYFGWPIAHEDEAERAVRAGLALGQSLAGVTTPAAEPLAARVGIATGLVMVGELIGEGAARRSRRRGDPESRCAIAGAGRARVGRDQPGDPPADRRSVRARGPRAAAAQRLYRAACRLAGERRGAGRRALRGAAERGPDAAGRP
jgi:class 3 adenylate cyclase